MFAVAAVSSGEDPFGHLWHIATRKEHVPPKSCANAPRRCGANKRSNR